MFLLRRINFNIFYRTAWQHNTESLSAILSRLFRARYFFKTQVWIPQKLMLSGSSCDDILPHKSLLPPRSTCTSFLGLFHVCSNHYLAGIGMIDLGKIKKYMVGGSNWSDTHINGKLKSINDMWWKHSVWIKKGCIIQRNI